MRLVNCADRRDGIERVAENDMVVDEHYELCSRCPMCGKEIRPLIKTDTWSLCMDLGCLSSVTPIPVLEWVRNA